jgi:catechol 2,3-dioxygenase-like lactoylglutathione lyase family enzyme
MSPLDQRVVPALRITDYDRSKAFYTDGLGFRIEWEPGFPVFLSIERDGMRIFLSQHTGDCQVGGLVHFYVADVDAWYAEFVGRKVVVKEPPGEHLPGLRDMTLVDPDGNQLRFLTRL